jgi:type IV secretory pathway VirB2 component (pilin)
MSNEKGFARHLRCRRHPNNIATFILGPFGQSIAVLSVIGLAVAFMFGRATLGLLGGLVGGLVLIFGASYLVSQFVGSGA